MREWVAAMIVLQQQLMQSDGARSEMQTQLNTLRAQKRTGTGVGVDTMNVCCLANFNGTVSAIGLCWRTQSGELKIVTEPVFNAGLQASSESLLDVHHLLLRSTSWPELNQVENARSGEGLRAWQILLGLWDASVHVEDCWAVVGIVSL